MDSSSGHRENGSPKPKPSVRRRQLSTAELERQFAVAGDLDGIWHSMGRRHLFGSDFTEHLQNLSTAVEIRLRQDLGSAMNEIVDRVLAFLAAQILLEQQRIVQREQVESALACDLQGLEPQRSWDQVLERQQILLDRFLEICDQRVRILSTLASVRNKNLRASQVPSADAPPSKHVNQVAISAQSVTLFPGLAGDLASRGSEAATAHIQPPLETDDKQYRGKPDPKGMLDTVARSDRADSQTRRVSILQELKGLVKSDSADSGIWRKDLVDEFNRLEIEQMALEEE